MTIRTNAPVTVADVDGYARRTGNEAKLEKRDRTESLTTGP